MKSGYMYIFITRQAMQQKGKKKQKENQRVEEQKFTESSKQMG